VIDYQSDKMPTINPNMYDINDLFANFTNNWYHLRFVLSLLFGIIFGFFLIKKVLESMDEMISIGEAADRAKDRLSKIGEGMKYRAGIAAEITKEKAASAAERVKEKTQAAMDVYGDNQLRRMELRQEAKLKFHEQMDAFRQEQQNAVVFLAALSNRKTS
jgi:hypothetical protein